MIDRADFCVARDGTEIPDSYASTNIASIANVSVLAYLGFRIDSDGAIKFHWVH